MVDSKQIPQWIDSGHPLVASFVEQMKSDDGRVSIRQAISSGDLLKKYGLIISWSHTSTIVSSCPTGMCRVSFRSPFLRSPRSLEWVGMARTGRSSTALIMVFPPARTAPHKRGVDIAVPTGKNPLVPVDSVPLSALAEVARPGVRSFCPRHAEATAEKLLKFTGV